MGIGAHYLEDKDGNKFYPMSHADVSYDRNGNTVGKRLDETDQKVEELNNSTSKNGHTHTAAEAKVVHKYETKADFPLPGEKDALYIATLSDEQYHWVADEFKYHRLNSIEKINKIDGNADPEEELTEATIRAQITLNGKNSEEWELNKDFIPAKNEICIYTDFNKAKIGDGISTIEQLKFAWYNCEEILAMIHGHENLDILSKTSAIYTIEVERTIADLIAKNGEENVQSDFMESDEESDAYIKNKPTKLSNFTNDIGFMKSADLDSHKEELREYADAKAEETKTESATYTDKAIEKVMGGITNEKLDTLQELAKAIEENGDVVEAINSSVIQKADANKVYPHIEDKNIHVTPELKEKWDIAEKNQDAYSRIAVNNVELLKAAQATYVVNYEAGEGIEIEAVHDIYDTVKIKNTRIDTRYDLVTEKEKPNGEVAIDLIGTDESRDTIPVIGTGITTVTTDSDGKVVINTDEVVDIRGNAGTATKLQTPRDISITGGASAAIATFDGSDNVELNITELDPMALKKKDEDTLIIECII